MRMELHWARRKELRFPELAGDHGRARWVVIASEVGGRWSEESRDFLRQLAKAKTRSAPCAIRSRLRLAWTDGAGCWLVVGSVRLPSPSWSIEEVCTPTSHDVEWEARCLYLVLVW